MTKEIKVSFYASVDEDALNDVRNTFYSCGAAIIYDNFPELDNIGGFTIEVDPIDDDE